VTWRITKPWDAVAKKSGLGTFRGLSKANAMVENAMENHRHFHTNAPQQPLRRDHHPKQKHILPKKFGLRLERGPNQTNV
jgi:hypothetical protein